MKYAILAMLTVFSLNSLACMSGAEFYSVVTPENLGLLSRDPQKLVVGDILNIKQHLKIEEGQSNLQELGFVESGTYADGKYYLVKKAGKIVVGLFAPTDTNPRVSYEATEPIRTRGGCGDHRNPASVSSPKKK